MGKKLFVGNLPYSVNDDQLRQAFVNAGVGTVETATVIMDKFTGRSKGFGFVEMSTDEEAQNAIGKLNGTDLGGRAVVVNEARPMQERKPGGFGGGRGGYRGGRSGGSDRY
jgi:RNA recognition motif-containing protein